MLEEYKRMYEEKASVIPNWRQISKNDLCNLYVDCDENHNELAENYLAAIICRYWPAIDKLYTMSSNCATKEDCYEWLIDAIMYALNHRAWKDPKNKLFEDEKAPDKVINRCIKSVRLTFYQGVNRDKRRLNFQLLSIEDLQDKLKDALIPHYEQEYEEMKVKYAKDQVIAFFNRKEYIIAFILDGILFTDCFKRIQENDDFYLVFSISKLCKTLRNLDESYFKVFSKRYNIPINTVTSAYSYVEKLTPSKLETRVKNSLIQFRKLFKKHKD